MTVTVDPTRCIACGMCAYAAPEVFRVVGRASAVIAQPQPSRSSRVWDAANGCPVNAITIRKD
ncbi:ferredoxin [uncultured Dysosmobacter sp.]|uniref:ferredoxin n=1 Tax=uncultured Dysosmobacter sp. TaxID=2591384 RepID=UPI00262205DD|nr:ferredoxin [uncultured Dysosmobacter sp.]